MFKSTTLRAALALPVLSTLFVMLSAGAMSAQAATVTSSAHYQKRIGLNCSSLSCSGNFPAVAANHVLNLTRLTCLLNATDGSTFSVGGLTARNVHNAFLLEEYVAVVHSSSDGAHAINQAVDMQAAATQYMSVQMNLASGTAIGADCVATGTMDALQ